MKQWIIESLIVTNVMNGIFLIIDSIFPSNDSEFRTFLIEFSIGVFIMSMVLN